MPRKSIELQDIDTRGREKTTGNVHAKLERH